MPFIGLQAFKVKLFSKNSLCSSILNHLQTKVTLKNPNSCIFFFTIYNPKVVTVLTNLIFLVLGLQMIKNSLMQPLTILFCILAQPLRMSLFLKFFFILITLQQQFPRVKYHLCWICISNKNKTLKTVNF